jgi:hypothetical protein
VKGYDSFQRIKRKADFIIPLHDDGHLNEKAIG